MIFAVLKWESGICWVSMGGSGDRAGKDEERGEGPRRLETHDG
jgi:hypothetical protein